MVRKLYWVLLPDGTVWCETSDPREAVDKYREAPLGSTLARCEVRTVYTPWEPWDGVEP